MSQKQTTANIDLQVIMASEFPYVAEYLKEYSSLDCVGVAFSKTGEAFVLIDILLGSKNIKELHLGESCWDCKHVNIRKKTWVCSISGKTELIDCLSCSLNHDEVIEAILIEITITTVHEIIHLFGLHNEEIVRKASASIAKPWEGCLKFTLDNERLDGCVYEYTNERRK